VPTPRPLPTPHLRRRVQDEQQRREVVLPPDFEALDPRQYTSEMQQYIEYRRKARMDKMDRAGDNEIWGIAATYMAVTVVALALAAGISQY
jgi:hypothetical protein